MDSSLDLPTLRALVETLRADRQEFNVSGQDCQRKIHEAQDQIQSLNVRVEQLRGAIAHVDLVEKRLLAEIEARSIDTQLAALLAASTPTAPATAAAVTLP